MEREEYETNESFKIRSDFAKKFWKHYKTTANNKVEAVIYSKIFRNMALLNCRYETLVEKKVAKIQQR